MRHPPRPRARQGAGVALATLSAVALLAQTRALATLGEGDLHAKFAAAFSTNVAALAVLVPVAAPGLPDAVRGLRHAPPRAWHVGVVWAGGLAFMLSSTLLPLALSIALLTVGRVGGNLAASLVIDRAGWAANERRTAVTPRRLVAPVVALVATLVGVGDVGGGAWAPAWLMLAVIAGAAGALQTAGNGHLLRVLPRPAVLLVGFGGGAIVNGVLTLATGTVLPLRPGLTALSAACGVCGVLTAALAARRLDATRLAVTMIAAQAVAAPLVDRVFPFGSPSAGPATLIGSALLLIAAAFEARRPPDAN
jgi:uncharacterized membrane protein YdcZ (DUF606 family)